VRVNLEPTKPSCIDSHRRRLHASCPVRHDNSDRRNSSTSESAIQVASARFTVPAEVRPMARSFWEFRLGLLKTARVEQARRPACLMSPSRRPTQSTSDRKLFTEKKKSRQSRQGRRFLGIGFPFGPVQSVLPNKENLATELAESTKINQYRPYIKRHSSYHPLSGPR